MDFRILRSKKKIKIKITRQEVVNGIVSFPGGSAVKNPPANAGDRGLIPGSGRTPGAGHGSPLQYSFLEKSMDRRAECAMVCGVEKSQT